MTLSPGFLKTLWIILVVWSPVMLKFESGSIYLYELLLNSLSWLFCSDVGNNFDNKETSICDIQKFFLSGMK